jgi:hypothetical protein
MMSTHKTKGERSHMRTGAKHCTSARLQKPAHDSAQQTLFPNQKTITRSELHRLSFLNSKKLPSPCVIEGVVKDWVGIGWVALDRKPLPTDTVMIEDT